MMTEKFVIYCVFCGKEPEDKTKEHVIPRWLMRLTGDERRNVFLGVRYSDGIDNIKIHKHSFSTYTAPACRACNSKFSELEDLAKSTIESILIEKPVSANEIEILLDWLDKVRIGLWLAGRMIGTNVFRAMQPKFHIADRIRWGDRWARLTLLPESVGNGLTYMGVGTPMFGCMPSVFTLRINRLVIQNASSPRILTRWLGLPYPSTKRIRTPNGLVYHGTMRYGKGRLLPDMMKYRKPGMGLEILQPAYPFTLKDCERLFQKPYVRAFFSDLETLRAKPLIAKKTEISAFEAIGPNEYALMQHIPDQKFPHDLSCSTLLLQNHVSQIGLHGGPFASEKEFQKSQSLMNGLRGLNKHLIRMMDDQFNDPSKSNDGSVEVDLGQKVISI